MRSGEIRRDLAPRGSLEARWAAPATRPKKEPGYSDRDISGLIEGGSYTSEARSWGNTPPGTADGGQDRVAVFAPRGGGRLPVMGGIDVRLAHQLPGKLAVGHASHHSFDKLS